MKETLVVKINKLDEKAVIPEYAKDGDAGMDITATSILSENMDTITYGTGIAIEIPRGSVGLVYPRSSVRKKDLILANSVGVIDSGYRGEIQVTFKKVSNTSAAQFYTVGERVCQIVIMPHPSVRFVEVRGLSDSERGVGGHGSSGN